MKKNKKVLEHLKNSYIARNCHKEGYIDYLKKYHCKNSREKAIIEKVMTPAISGASYQRLVAKYQNKHGLYPASFIVQSVRSKYQTEIHNEYSNGFFDAVYRWYKKIF